MKQHEVIAIINRDYPQMDSFVESEYQYTTYDAENKNYILEIKSRKSRYEKWLIEKHKFDTNLDIALKKNKQFIYLTEYRTDMLVWNINDLINVGYDFGWELKEQPKTTDFDNNNKIMKEVGYLHEHYAKIL
tara:strand:+ start:241 stop:636 length:396 start_codon:yes stop_codon:yes gene_type:complete